MHTVLFTGHFLRQAEIAAVTGDELDEIVWRIARDPLCGDLIPGTGGARKVRHAVGGRGKSGGARTIHYFGGGDVPVFLLAVYTKSSKENLTMKERNELATILSGIAAAYRQSRRSN